jgi:xanthine dehydrogenase accessory factor
MTADDVIVEAGRLAAEGRPFALATVVRVRRPASTRRGDRAVIRPDGTLVGWIGGACSEPIVIREALRALAAGEPRLVRIGPSGAGREEGADVIAVSGCASEGTVEVLIEPGSARPWLAVIGGSPAARSLAALAASIGWRVETTLEGAPDAVVVAAMGTGDEEVLERALESGAGYVGLVASTRRATAVLETLRDRGVPEDELARVRSPAGLDLGPLPQEEIGVAILAELVAWRHARGAGASETAAAPDEAVDPVCGMTVPVHAGTISVVMDGATYHFCCAGCRARFESDPASFVSAPS